MKFVYQCQIHTVKRSKSSTRSFEDRPLLHHLSHIQAMMERRTERPQGTRKGATTRTCYLNFGGSCFLRPTLNYAAEASGPAPCLIRQTTSQRWSKEQQWQQQQDVNTVQQQQQQERVGVHTWRSRRQMVRSMGNKKSPEIVLNWTRRKTEEKYSFGRKINDPIIAK